MEEYYVRSRMQKVSTFYLNAFKSYPIVKIRNEGDIHIHTHIRHPPLKNYSPRRNFQFRRGQKTDFMHFNSAVVESLRRWDLEVNHLRRDLKRTYFARRLSEAGRDSRAMWKVLHSFINRREETGSFCRTFFQEWAPRYGGLGYCRGFL